MATDPDGPIAAEEARALRELLQSPGWQLLRDHADREWGPRAFGIKMRHALSQTYTEAREVEIAHTAQRLEATATAVDELITWPTQRLRQLEGHDDPRAFASLRRTS